MLLLVAVFAGVASAQSRATSADLTGIVKDPSNAVVPWATVTATNLETALQRVSVSGPDGRFVLPALPLGTYRIAVDLDGFDRHVVERVPIQLGSFPEIEVVLRPAGVEEKVTVTAPEPAESPSAVIANVVSQQQIARLPINVRNFISFSLTTPGVTADRMPVQGATATSGLSFSGQRARYNNITVDGLDNNDEVTGSVRATFSQEAVREFQVLAQSYSAEFGKASGGVVNIVTKSGTNVPGGTAFGYFRDDALNAREHFERFDPAGRSIDRPKAPFGQQQYGGVFGGPIRRDRTFFFGAFERLDVSANNFVTIDDTTPVVVHGRPVGTAAELLRAAGFPVETGHVPYDIHSNQLVVKLDQTLRNGDTLTLRYNLGHGRHGNVETWGGLVARSRGAELVNRDHMIAVSHTAVLSARLVNELRVQAASRRQKVLPLDPTCDGPCDRDDEGGPTVEIGGVANVGRNRVTPQLRDNVRFQVLDTISYQTGSHFWKAGIDLNVIDHSRSTIPLHFGGRFIFAPLPAIPGILPQPVSAIQAFALGLPAAYVQGYGNPGTEYTAGDLSAFIQDQWQAAPGLTISAGLRYQRQFWPERVYTVPGYGSFDFPVDGNNLAPRLGVAWRPRPGDTLTVRGGYGVYYNNIISAMAAIADVINGTPDGLRTLVARFPRSVEAWNAPGRRLSEAQAGRFPSLVISIDPGLKTSYAHQITAGVDRRMPWDLWFSANVIGVRGFNQLGAIDYNPLVPALGPGRRPEDVNGQPGTSASVLQYTSYGESWYRALSVSARKRTARYEFLAGYVLSRAEDNSTDFQTAFIPQTNGMGRNPADPEGLPVGFDPDDERGRSLQDQPHRFVFSGWGRGPWAVELAALVTIASGVPYNILAGTDLNGDGDGGTFPNDRARRNPADPSTSLPRNAGRLPHEATIDLRVSRRFTIAGSTTIEPIFEVFNLLNRVNYSEINNVFGTGAYPNQPLPTFGQFQRAGPPRQAQVGLRVAF
ncbi:MAG TPA: TonB-dependent receptor [Vicinamibacterales bacterium]|nr:TonB-dependent receptor [Vicinamibacterales bacterium]